MMNERNYDDLKYSDIYLIGIIESYFNSLFSNKVIDDMPKVKVHPNNKFYYNVCPFHKNNSEYYEFFVDERVHLFYCLGCGSRGNAFDFLIENNFENNRELTLNSSCTNLKGIRTMIPFDFPIKS